ncbi:MAG: MBL fold metallo-hydrolase [Rhodospirillaceae bacterium]|nr:MBL fold metallo-hydrolase [Rhodospirillaceae bacterium]|tara:strand:- start:717 stop:1598 length:882 start_codon:yes stop_codon:yes gene_type:complete
MNKWIIGEVEITRVLEFECPLLDPLDLFPNADKETIEYNKHWLQPTLQDPNSGLLILSFHSFLIQTPRHLILVDTCGGNDKKRPQKPRYHMNSWPYLENLEIAKIHPNEIDYVLCTHLHVDHVGWNTRLVNGNWIPTFPNAKYLFSEREWDFWKEEYLSGEFKDDPYAEDSILPIFKFNQALLVDDNYQIDDWVGLETTPGHTPGHLSVNIRSGPDLVVMSGDIMHHPLQCVEPNWNSCFCVDPIKSIETRKKFLATHEKTQALIMPAHFPTPGAGRIIGHGNAYKFNFSEKF